MDQTKFSKPREAFSVLPSRFFISSSAMAGVELLVIYMMNKTTKRKWTGEFVVGVEKALGIPLFVD